MATVRQMERQLDTRIKAAEAKIEKYKGYIAKLNETVKELSRKKRALLNDAKKAAAKKSVKAAGKAAGSGSAAKKTASARSGAKKTAAGRSGAKKAPAKRGAPKKKEPSLVEGVLDELKKSGLDPSELLGGLLGGKK